MPDEIEVSKLDRRVAARMVRKGTLTDREVEKHLKTLPDLADKAVVVTTQFEETAGKGLEPER